MTIILIAIIALLVVGGALSWGTLAYAGAFEEAIAEQEQELIEHLQNEDAKEEEAIAELSEALLAIAEVVDRPPDKALLLVASAPRLLQLAIRAEEVLEPMAGQIICPASHPIKQLHRELQDEIEKHTREGRP